MSKQHSEASGSIRYPLFVLAAAGFVSSASMRIAEPLVPDIAAWFNTSIVDSASLISGFVLAYGLFQLVHGPLGDRFGKLRVIAVAVCLAALSSVGCAMAESLSSLVAFRFLSGMTAGAIIPLSFAFIGDNVPFAQRQRLLGRFIAGSLFGALVGPILAGYCSQYFGWRASFIAVAIGFFLIAVLLVPCLGAHLSPGRKTGGTLVSLAALLRERTVRVICAIVAIEGFLFYGAFGYLGAYLREDFRLDFVLVGFVLAGFGLGGLVYSATVGLLVSHLGIIRMVIAAGVLMGTGFIGLGLVDDWRAATVIVCFLGFGFFMMHNTLQTQASEMAPTMRGAAIAVFAFSLFIGQGLGVAIDGQIVELFGFRVLLTMTGIGLFTIAIVMAKWLPSNRA